MFIRRALVVRTTLMTALFLSPASAIAANVSKIALAGVNLPGLAWDISVLGSAYSNFEGANCNASFDVYPHIDPPEHYFEWRKLGFNLFRLPVGWQHIQAGLGGPLNTTTLQPLDRLVDAITSDGSTAILDIHNYARWYCSIIGQPENSIPSTNLNVTDDDFVDLWTKLAEHYKDNQRVIFQLMNEPHDLNMTRWARTNQKVVSAIRATNATQRILISGTQFARMTDWTDYSMAALSTVVDPIANTLYDFHQYFDDDGGAYGACEPWETFLPRLQWVTSFLRGSGRRGMMTEFGGSPVPGCVVLFNELLQFFEANKDVWLGWTAWGAFNPGDLYLTTESGSPFNTLTTVLAKYAPQSTDSTRS